MKIKTYKSMTYKFTPCGKDNTLTVRGVFNIILGR
mgnify:CR=1